MIKFKLLLFAMMYILYGGLSNVQACAVKTTFKNCRVNQDSAVKNLITRRIHLIMSIPSKQDINLYYIKLMMGLYDGANELLDFEKGNNIKIMQQAELFRQFHLERKQELSPFLKNANKKALVKSQFSAASNAALGNFLKVDYSKYQTDNDLITALLIEYYENMDQISVAFMSFSQNEKLKAISWSIIRKQNKIISLLKPDPFRQ